MDSADTSESVFFSKVSSRHSHVYAPAANSHGALTAFGKFKNITSFSCVNLQSLAKYIVPFLLPPKKDLLYVETYLQPVVHLRHLV